MTPPALIESDSLTVRYPKAAAPAVDGVSFRLAPGECLGLVGASGCGKSTVARALLGLQPVASGRILWQGRDTAAFSAREKAEYRRAVQIVFQDTLGALNPRMRIRTALDEVLRVHRRERFPTAADRSARILALLDRVELPAETADRYPHELSGGQRQRIGIARALAVEPRLLVADEPVSALDVAVQAQVLRMLRGLLDETGLSMLFVSHDLAVVRCLCPRALVMHAGRIVEEGPTEKLFSSPSAPFTKELLSAVPRL